MRRFLLAGLFALGVPAAALAQNQVMIEARIADVVRLDFDLGFKLGCDHTVQFVIANPSLLQPYDPPATTRAQSFTFMVNGFGTTLVTANFTGAGGGCAGAASDSLLVTLQPDLSDVVRGFGSNAKALAKIGKTLKKNELGALEAELGEILDDYSDGLLTLNGAIAALAGETAGSQAFVAASLAGGLTDLSEAGSLALLSGGALRVPPALATGAKGSLWDGAVDSAESCYADFVADAETLLCDALAELASRSAGSGLQSAVRLAARFPLSVGGPQLADDPVDVPVFPPGFLALTGWSSSAGSGLLGVGAGVPAGGPNGKVRFVGPGERDETFTVPFEMSARQNLLLLITPMIVSEPPAALAVSATPAPGNWRLELRYDGDTNPADVGRITSP